MRWTEALPAALAVALVLSAGAARADGLAPLEITAGWSRAAPAGGSSSVFVRLQEDGAQPDTLLAAACPIADHTALQAPQGTQPQGAQPQGTQAQGTQAQGTQAQGVQPQGAQNGAGALADVAQVPVPGDQAVVLAPGAVQITLTGLHAALTPGELVHCALRFADHGERLFEAVVAPAGATAPPPLS